MKKIGIISDTHNCFDDPLRRFLNDVDELWHAGDFGSLATADAIAAFKPLKGVYGNIDDSRLRSVYPEKAVWDSEEIRVFMTHIGGYPGRYERQLFPDLKKAAPGLVVCGHSHILKVQYDKINGWLYINPGAAGNYGFHRVRTAVRLCIDGDRMYDLEVGEWQR